MRTGGLMGVTKFAAMTWLIGALGACASQGQQGQQQNQDDLNSQENETENFQGNAGNAPAQGEEAGEGTTPSDGGGADVNSATEEDPNLNATLNGGTGAPSNDTEAGVDPLAAANPSANLAANPSTPPPPEAPANDVAAAPAPSPSSPSPSAPAPAPSGDSAPIQGGRVRYVKEGGIQVVNAPGGTPVHTLEQGDHPVTWEENGWLKLSSGMYVPAGSLSDEGVGRPHLGNPWR